MIVAVALLASCSSSGSDAQDDSDGDEPDAPSEAETDEATPPVRVATLNLLHGLFCPPETDACQAPDRVRISTELVEDADCPELIGLQEIGRRGRSSTSGSTTCWSGPRTGARSRSTPTASQRPRGPSR